jgi:enoyl-CoA hydratase/carnithine racemase
MSHIEDKHAILFEIIDHVMYIRINRPETHNCLDWRDSFDLAGAYAVANATSDLRAIVVTGTGDYFHTGGLRHDNNDAYERERFSDQLRIRNKLIADFKVPLIVAVNGECSGGGMSLLLYADIAIASEKARFGYPEILHGSFPVMSMVNTIDVLPKKTALKSFYFGELFDAEEARRCGLVNYVVPEEELMNKTEHIVRTIVSRPAELIALGRNAYQEMVKLPLPERREYGQKVLQEVMKAQAKYEKPEDKRP